MATLTVRNVGPVREATLELKKHTVFIGPQGSGKSTLAKLIAIGSGISLEVIRQPNTKQPFENYNLSNYITNSSFWYFLDDLFLVSYDQKFDIDLTKEGYAIDQNFVDNYNRENGTNSGGVRFYRDDLLGVAPEHWVNMKVYTRRYVAHASHLQRKRAVYIPTERMITSALSNAVWGMLYTGTTIPRPISMFGSLIEESRNNVKEFSVPFLKIRYERSENIDYVRQENNSVLPLSEAASGYQAIIPLLQVVKDSRKQKYPSRLIIEEPELNLFPTAQKELIYSLHADNELGTVDNEWIMTTHSPYVLSSYNTLLLAYKVAQKSANHRRLVSEVIPEKSWINPEDFIAYYVNNGSVRNIMNSKTGLISDNELDQVSVLLGEEQDKLLQINREAAYA